MVVSFGATWCKPCEWELTALEELKAEYANRPVKFLWVSIETEKEAADEWLRQYAKAHRLTMPVLRDTERTVFAQFSTRLRLPMIVFFNQRGEFAAPRHTGMSADPIEYKQRMRARIDGLLKAGSAGILPAMSAPARTEAALRPSLSASESSLSVLTHALAGKMLALPAARFEININR